MKTTILAITMFVAFGTSFCQAQNTFVEEEKVSTVLDAWHKAAAEANFEEYFGHMTEDAIFIGTDATENWTFAEFKKFSKPYFDKGKAWSFSAVERHIFFADNGKIAWFDELLDTQMKLCRGSGVLELQKGGDWKIVHYVLSLAIPNENVEQIVGLKSTKDSILTKMLKEKQ
ncbi:nuclear transport factor 2 family protein [Sungkyunkwania multivorans]|uniref:Nuclear transport factor 2 family protein n=1 Tax=Sungkyunkwania multivorans TaxID=1173618 RepID=A0ABW3CYK5_9FLAO